MIFAVVFAYVGTRPSIICKTAKMGVYMLYVNLARAKYPIDKP